LIKHLNEPVPPLTDFSHIDNDYLDAVISMAMAKNPDHRYQTAGDLADDLVQAFQDEMPTVIERSLTRSTVETEGVTLVQAPVARSQEAKAKRQNSSPLGILVIGFGAMVAVLAIAFMINRDTSVLGTVPTIDPPSVSTEVALESGDSSSEIDSMTSADNMSFITTFDTTDTIATNYWPTNTTAGDTPGAAIARSLTENGEFLITNTIRNRVATTVVEDFYFTEDIDIEAGMSLDSMSTNNSGYGLIFHYIDRRNFGVFAVDGQGRFSLWFLEDGSWRELRDAGEDWTENSAVNPIGELNTLRLEIRETMLRGFVNGEEVVALEDGTLTEGGVGVYVAAPDRAEALAQVALDSYEVTLALDGNSAVTSMTGESEDS
ncbi:MAG: hypothetical protein AAF125_09465, partial [Chloroflexota bacterium]